MMLTTSTRVPLRTAFRSTCRPSDSSPAGSTGRVYWSRRRRPVRAAHASTMAKRPVAPVDPGEVAERVVLDVHVQAGDAVGAHDRLVRGDELAEVGA